MKLIPFNRSFASHPKHIYWNNKNKKSPYEVTINSSDKYLFNCDKCNHTFLKRIGHIIEGSWCPFCSNKTLCKKIKCTDCYQKSFATNIKSIHWSINNKVKCYQVFKSSGLKYLFNCDKCNHEFEMSLRDITNCNYWCNYCSNNKLCENIDCKDCFEKSFASHEKSKFWSNKNQLISRQVFKSSGNKYYFRALRFLNGTNYL